MAAGERMRLVKGLHDIHGIAIISGGQKGCELLARRHELLERGLRHGCQFQIQQQHLGDLPSRLAANPCTLYDSIPIPPVKYEELVEEVWCASFYLNNLCDDARFGDWAIADPVALLRAVLDAWRLEVVKTGEKGVSLDEAYGIMGLPVGAEDKEIRKAYRKLAIKFHPDKNPAGRETFEKIQKAYEAITNAQRPGQAGSGAGGPDPYTVLLMVRTQCILFARHSKVLRTYKYAGYPLLLESMALKPDDVVAGDRAASLEACTRLVYLTCQATLKNAEELVREGGTECLIFLMSPPPLPPLRQPSPSRSSHLPPHTHSDPA